MSRPYKILAGLILGTVLGLLCHLIVGEADWLDYVIKNIAQPIGQLFLRMIFMIVVPLIFSILVLGIFELGDIRSLGRIGAKTFVYTIIASLISVVVGMTLVRTFEPGRGFEGVDFSKLGININQQASGAIENAAAAKSVPETLVELIPKNPLSAAVHALDGDMIAFMVFALIFGVALVLVRQASDRDPLVKILETLRDVSMKIVDFAMALAPLGIASLMFAVTAKLGFGMLVILGKYVLVVLGGLLFQQLVVYGLILKFYVKYPPLQFLRSIREVIITAFSTASSNATLPTAIRVTQENLGVNEKISSFVLTIGSAANQNGTALFEGITILFLAQVFGIDLSFGQQFTVLIMAIVAGIGTAGVPGGSIPLIVIVMQTVGIPAEGIGLILGVDRLLDMSRTVLNVTGDIVAACVINRSENKRIEKQMVTSKV